MMSNNSLIWWGKFQNTSGIQKWTYTEHGSPKIKLEKRKNSKHVNTEWQTSNNQDMLLFPLKGRKN